MRPVRVSIQVVVFVVLGALSSDLSGQALFRQFSFRISLLCSHSDCPKCGYPLNDPEHRHGTDGVGRHHLEESRPLLIDGREL